MNASELKYQIESTGRESHFFDRKTMRFFGDRMSNFGVRSATVIALGDVVNQETGKYETVTREVWELYRKRPVKGGNQKSHYFDKVTFRQVYRVKG